MGVFTRSLVFFLSLSSLHCVTAAPPHAKDEYDYIVVGSGPGGGPLAANLARAHYSVLLIEAGDLSLPGPYGQDAPQVTWDFFVKHYEDEKRNRMNNHLVWKTKDGQYWVGPGNSTPPKGAEYLGIYYPRGATVGGSSMINAMCVWLPPASDWDYIANLTGDKSWRGGNMRQIFQRIERNHYLPPGTPGHGFDGYFETNMLRPALVEQPKLAIMQAMAKNLSLPTDKETITKMMGSDVNLLDPKRDTTNSFYGLSWHTKANFERYSSRDYVQDTIAQGYPLTLSTNSLATKVAFSKQKSKSCKGKPRATTLEYISGASVYKADFRWRPSNKGTRKTASARKEIIISGGTFNTPQLLQLSGIGPRALLKKHHIPLIVDAPGVGANLQDNPELPIVANVTKGENGPFGQPNAIAMLTTPNSPDGERDMFIMHGPGAFRGFWPSNQTNPALQFDGPHTYGVSMVKGKVGNRAGYVRVRSSDPTEPPEINFNLFEEKRERDMGAMKSVIAWVRKRYVEASKFNGTVQVAPMDPPCPSGLKDNGFCKDEQEDEAWITGQTFGHHPTSTAAIGKDGDEMAVLDSRCRVRGVSGLRVVDASVFPRIPGVFPVVSTFMVSEKASDVIKEDAKRDICTP